MTKIQNPKPFVFFEYWNLEFHWDLVLEICYFAIIDSRSDDPPLPS